MEGLNRIEGADAAGEAPGASNTRRTDDLATSR